VHAFVCLSSESAFAVAARSKAWLCGRSLARTAVSNPVGGMGICLL
jgi:hypothetical protein